MLGFSNAKAGLSGGKFHDFRRKKLSFNRPFNHVSVLSEQKARAANNRAEHGRQVQRILEEEAGTHREAVQCDQGCARQGDACRMDAG